MIVALGLPLNVAVIILGWILSMLLSVFYRFRSYKHPYPSYCGIDRVFPSWYSGQRPSIAYLVIFDIFGVRVSVFLYANYVYLMFYGWCDKFGSWPILFRVLTLNVAICIVCLHFSSFCLSSVADFSNTEARAPTSAGRTPFLPARRAMRFMYVVWVWVMVIFRWLFLFSSIETTLIDELQ